MAKGNKILGKDFPKSLGVWSTKNEKTPFDYTPHSIFEAWWVCENGIHDDYKRKITRSTSCDYRCPKCSVENKPRKYQDLTGMKFGELTVVSFNDEETKKHSGSFTYWNCICSCGKECISYSASLKDGRKVTCGDRSIHRLGKNNSNWKGGVAPIRLSQRTSKEYNSWRDSVYAKDWYTCQCCGEHKNIEKNAHHLLNFSEYEDLRYDVNNGITLCKSCHYSTEAGSFHNLYGTSNNTPGQLEEYINYKRKQLGINIPFSIEEYKNGNILKPLKLNTA